MSQADTTSSQEINANAAMLSEINHLRLENDELRAELHRYTTALKRCNEDRDGYHALLKQAQATLSIIIMQCDTAKTLTKSLNTSLNAHPDFRRDDDWDT